MTEQQLQAIKPFLDFCRGRMFDLFEDEQVLTLGSPLARPQLKAKHFRELQKAFPDE